MLKILNNLADNHYLLGIVSLGAWSSLYIILSFLVHKVEFLKRYPLLSRIYVVESFVSIIQGFVCGGIGLLAVLNCKEDVMKLKYKLIDHYCVIGTGYFMYDLVAMYRSNTMQLKEKSESLSTLNCFTNYLRNCGLMIAHHIILTGFLFPALIKYSSMGHFFAGCFFCMELSSPFVNFRIILSKLGLKKTKLYLYNGITMMIVFAIFRVVVFLYMYFMYILQMTSGGMTVLNSFLSIPLFCHLCCLLILSPQVYWLSMMINGVYVVLTNRPKALDKYD